MPQFNIYRIPKNKEIPLSSELIRIGLRLEKNLEIKSFKVAFFLHYDINEMWWINYYSDWISDERKNNPDEDLQNKNYYGAIIFSNDDICYVISLGKTHFLIKKYCEYDFGIRFAQKVINKDNVTLLNANSFGGNKRKTLNTFASNSTLEPESGEAIVNIKGGTVNEGVLGNFISCGDSVSITLEEYNINDLPNLLVFINDALLTESLFDLPTSKKVVDPVVIDQLDYEIGSKIMEFSEDVDMAEMLESDSVGFLFRGDFYIKYLLCNRHKIEINDNLYFENIKLKLEEREIEFNVENILALKVKIENSFGQSFTKPIKYFLDYVNQDKYFLNEGNWYQFNQKYLEFLDNAVSMINIDFKPELNDSYQKYNEWCQENKDDAEFGNRSKWYFEKYFNEYIMPTYEFINTDRKVTLSKDDDFRRYKLEISDAINEDTVAFVKKGTLQKLNYVIDQSLATFKYLQENNWEVSIGEERRRIRKMCLVLLFERQAFEKLTETESIIFKIKLNEWRKKLLGSNIEPQIWCAFCPKNKKEKEIPATKKSRKSSKI